VRKKIGVMKSILLIFFKYSDAKSLTYESFRPMILSSSPVNTETRYSIYKGLFMLQGQKGFSR